MRIHPQVKLIPGLSLLVLLLASLACSIGSGSDSAAQELALQQTSVALKATNMALNNQISQNETAPTTSAPIEPTVQPTTSAPAEQPDVAYNGISFSFDPSIADSFFSTTIPEQNMGEDYMPGETYPTTIEFSANDYAVSDHFHSAVIRIYPVAEYRALSSYASTIIDSLQQTLNNKPAGGPFSNLPFLPMWNAAQVFSSNVTYFDFQNGSGVRYLTMYGQAAYPVDNQNLFYTYQGLTNDGQYYISAILPVTHPDLPFDGASEVDDWMAFDENFQTYLDNTISWLNGQDPSEFTPSLFLLDEMMASFLSTP